MDGDRLYDKLPPYPAQLVLAGKKKLQRIDLIIFTCLQYGDQRQQLLDG